MKIDVLEFDYETIQGQSLRRVLGRAPLAYDDGSIAFDEVKFSLETCSLLFSVNIDTDEVICSRVIEQTTSLVNDEIWLDIDTLSSFVGSEIGWLWLSKNWMGYVDMATLSFAGIEPTIALVGAASKLSIYRLHKIANYLPTDLPAN